MKDFSIRTFRPSAVLLTASQLLDAVVDNAQDIVFFKDAHSRYIIGSQALAAYFGLDTPAALIGRTDDEFCPADFTAAAAKAETEIISSGEPLLGQVEKWDKGAGEAIWFSVSRYPLYDDDHQIVGTWGTWRDISGLLAAEEEMARLAEELELAQTRLKTLSMIDELSGLYNQRHFFKSLQATADYILRYLATDPNGTFSLLLADIDQFARLNQEQGHLAGNAAIRHVASLLRAKSRSSDLVFRLENDRFALILPSTSIGNGRVLAERIRAALTAAPLTYEGQAVPLTVSMGVASCEEDMTIKELIEKAEGNLDLARRKGGNQTR